MSFYDIGAEMDERFTECLDFIMWLQRVESDAVDVSSSEGRKESVKNVL